MFKSLHALRIEQLSKVWSDSAREASALARRGKISSLPTSKPNKLNSYSANQINRIKQYKEVKSLPPDRLKDYWEHRRAGTPHEFAVGLAERGGN